MTIEVYNCTAVTVNWELNNINNDPVTKFDLFWQIASRNIWSVQSASSTKRSDVISNLNSGSSYTFGIQAIIRNIIKNTTDFDVSRQITLSM